MFNTFWNLNFEKSKEAKLDILHNLRFAGKKMSSQEDDLVIRSRAAPTRKRFNRNNDEKRGNSETPTATIPQTGDGSDEMIRDVTGKRFSFPKLFQRTSRKESLSNSSEEKDSKGKAEPDTESASEKSSST